ncbi:hypothetical protein RN001_010980 [Aquatica leii]|uniref:PAX-interacting protein 1 n=1 Tax=Aquatica leii TaxID=1421715 RepID=A0AAN7SGE6_9COLE|nr:hypothetical protein RN001_010980 [Aquatica leii]
MPDAADLNSLTPTPGLFEKIKYFISGEVPEKLLDLLKNAGAERMNYFSDYVTHLICGFNAEETDISDANELYEIPAVTPKWIVMCVQLNRILNTKPYLYDNKKLFSNLVFCLSKVSADRNVLWSLITYNGGTVQLQLNRHCTHLITVDITSAKYAKAVMCNIVLVTPDWVVECVKQKALIGYEVFHPRLIVLPKLIKHESTTAITGFEPENDVKGENDSTNATQALLEKLKQRMPWNQLATSCAKDIIPPNVVAPTFSASCVSVTTTQTTVQQRTPPKQVQMYPNQNVTVANSIARSIVHHTAQGTLIGQPPSQLTQFNQATHLHRFQLQQQQQQQQQQHQQRANLLSHITQQQQLNKVHIGSSQFNPPQLMQRQMQVGPQMQVANKMQLPPGAATHISQIGQPQIGQMQRPQMPSIGNLQQLQQQLANRQFANIQVQQQPQQQQQSYSNQPQIINQANQQLGLNQNPPQMIINQNQLGAILNQEQVLNRNQLEQQQLGTVINQNQVITQNVQNLGQIMNANAAPNQAQQILNQGQQQQQQPQQQVVVQQNHPHLTVQQGKILQGPFVQQAQPTDAQQFVHQFTPNQTYQQQIVQNPFTPNRPQSQFSAQSVVLNQQKPMIINQQGQPPQQQVQGVAQGNQPKPLWQQQQGQPPQQLGIRHASIIQQGPRVQWSPTQQPQQQQQHLPQRQFIQLDMQTHQQLQQMAPEQRAVFISKLQQKQRQVLLQQRQQQLQMHQRTGHVLIRSGPVPQGLNPQQQMQWIQQQAKQQGVMLQPPPPQQQQPQTNLQNPPVAPHTPGLSPIQQQNASQFNENQLQLQRQQQFRLQQLQLQREQAQKVAVISQPLTQTNIRPIGQPQTADIVTTTASVDSSVAQQQLVVNAKTKTALANMLSIRLQSGGSTVGTSPESLPEPSAAGTLRLMTAQHNAALNSNNRPQEILGLPQRRPITAPNGEIIRPAPPPSAPPPTAISNEPPQLQYSSRNNIPIQHRQGPFYGHNPNLKLPPDLFLLGCIFVVVELDRFLEESIPNWQEQIEKHGGEVEKQYCSRVTHVLCETQRHGVVMQALRDCKRCVTLYWLSDVMRRKQVLPPWTALHLPMMYLDTTPASKHLISLTGFLNSERNRIKHMIKYIGATFTNYLSKHNTLLIAAKAEGPKYAHAKKWATPVVNVQWLTDVMLGNFGALNQLEHIKYQQFPNPPVFNFEPSLVPSLMHAWKMPINISQESYERVKRSPSPVSIPKKIKKIKVEEVEVPTDEIPPSVSHRILFSLFTDIAELKNIVKELGGSIAHDHKDCTHLVMPYLGRTNKLLHCICLGVPILPESWLRDSHSARKFLDPSNYSLDTKDFNSEYKCDFNQTLMTRNRNKLFEGKFFYITPSVFPSRNVLTELIVSCGGCVEKHRRTLSQIEVTNINSPYSYIILTHANDLHLVYDVLRNKKDKIRTVCNVELIYSAILKQTFEVEPYSVQVCEHRR